MKRLKFCTIGAKGFVCISAALGLAATAAAVTLDLSKSVGDVPLVYGLSRPPFPTYDNWSLGAALRGANVPYLLMHNVGGAYGAGAFVDISNLFPDFSADENAPESYDFTVTDNLLQQMVRSKLAPIFRLGESEEELASLRRMRTNPPADAEKWARICEHVIRHYNERWDNGFRYDIEYWPVWYAPERSTCWGGTIEEFHAFYRIVATYLKAKFPKLKIGGPAIVPGAPLDFYMFEAPGNRADVVRRCEKAKADLAVAGFSNAEILPVVQPAASPRTAECAAEVAADLAYLAYSGAKAAVTGERDCAAGHFNPFHNPLTGAWEKPFQAIRAFDQLYAFRKLAAFRLGEGEDGLAVAAVRDDYGMAAALVANDSPVARPLVLDAPGYRVTECQALDAMNDLSPVSLPSEIAAHQVLVVRFRKVDAAERAPLERADGFAIDFSHGTGPVKPVHGAGQAPLVGFDQFLFRYYGEAGIPISRFHDTGGMQGRCVFADVSNVFPDFDADENDPGNYVFEFTDRLVRDLLANGTKIYYRLGETIETRSFYRRYRTNPPKDFAKWARISEHIVSHYNEGWAGGFTNAIAYVEIWNEPDGTEKPMYNGLWYGTFESFLDLYCVAAKHLKVRFPNLKVGGYGSTGFGGTYAGQPSDRHRHLLNCFYAFLKRVVNEGAPVDFFSYHCYGDADVQDSVMRFVRGELDKAGLKNAEMHNTEWKSGLGLGTSAQAACVAATLVAFQNGPIDAATIYDGRCGPSVYSVLFNPDTLGPHKAYYAFRMFNELYKDGRSVKTRADATSGLRLAAAHDGHGRGHALFVNCGMNVVPLSYEVTPGWKAVSCRLLDAERDDEPGSVPAAIMPCQVVLVTFEKTGS